MSQSTSFSAEQRRLLPVLLIPAFMTLLAVSSVNVTLPALDASLNAGPSGLQWVISGYALTFGVILVAAGRAGDVFGRGRLFLLGLAVFGLGSLLSGFAPDIITLNLARVLMGIGSGLLNPQVTGIIQQYYRGVQRGKAFGLFGGVIGVSVAIGPVLAGALIALFGDEWGWRASFLVNVPIAAFAIVSAWRMLPDSAWRGVSADDPSSTAPIPVQNGRPVGERKSRADFDPVGMLLLTAGILLVMFPFVEGQLGAWVWSLLAGGIALITVWVLWERRYKRRGRVPMVDMQLFRTRSFASGSVIIALYFLGFSSVWVLVAQYMQVGLGHEAIAAGLIGLPAALAGAVVAPIAGRYVVAVGRKMVLWGMLIGVAGLFGCIFVVFLHETAGGSEWWLLLTLGLLGVGQGFVVSPNQTLTLADVPVQYAGAAGGILQTGQRLGTSIGIVAITGLAFSVVAQRGWDEAFIYGFVAISAIALVAAAIAAFDLLQTRRERTRAAVGQ
ncbi:MAG TPA: MFS transporter [Candidatus Agrococcus pullicola]|uniref:MFS transporter n=1 Tax=Candidatus Agrococcus pullicola TaxID=2838429 RepID=A0A9D1YUI4_9MICO|nr:MFS transporter [Candidatus Agrococcus pullicola]